LYFSKVIPTDPNRCDGVVSPHTGAKKSKTAFWKNGMP
jgi:hypothetical protein